MIVYGAVPYNTFKQKDNLVKDIKLEFSNKVKISIDTLNKLVNYTSYQQTTV